MDFGLLVFPVQVARLLEIPIFGACDLHSLRNDRANLAMAHDRVWKWHRRLWIGYAAQE